ncbi:MAG: hypothetical protein R3B84_03140 [Zavarzinella sp.]
MKLTGAAILVSPGKTVLQAAQAGEGCRSAIGGERVGIATRMTEVLFLHLERLRGLVGQPVESARVVWYDPWDSLHAASPVVLTTGGRNLELWSIYVAEFGFTWGEIDFARPPFNWIGKPDPESRWVEAPQTALRRACGAVIRSVRLIPADDLCAGLELGFGGWALTLLTELDDLIVTDEPEWVEV